MKIKPNLGKNLTRKIKENFSKTHLFVKVDPEASPNELETSKIVNSAYEKLI